MKCGESLERLGKALSEEKSFVRPRYRGGWIAVSKINILPQPRKTFEDISELASDIAGSGQLKPPLVARFNRKNCIAHLELINEIWGTNFQMGELVSSGKKNKVFYVLIDGERRLRSCCLLWEEGCIDCREKHGEEAPGVCFRRHFQGDKIEVRLCDNVPPLKAIFLQFSANKHMRVPPHEEAQAHNQFLKLLKKADPSFSIARYARYARSSPQRISDAIRFCELPRSIQELVESGIVKYSIAIEASRLHINGVGEEELKLRVLLAVTNRKKAEDFRKEVTALLNHKKAGQTSMLDEFAVSEKKLIAKNAIRRTVALSMIQAVHYCISYFETVLRLFEEGRLGKSDSPYSVISPLKVLRKLLELEDNLLIRHLEGLMPKKKLCRAREVVRKALETTERLASKLET